MPAVPASILLKVQIARRSLTALGQQLCIQDTANEWAAKYGIMYQFATKTTVGGIVEYLHRDVPADLAFQNERQRWGTWLVVSQELSPIDSLHFGWAHAFKSPGNPGQHNDTTGVLNDGPYRLRWSQPKPVRHGNRGVEAQVLGELDLVQHCGSNVQRT